MRSNAKSVINKLAKALKQAQENMPKVLANEGTRFFMENFRKESWEGKRWRPRTVYGTKYNKNPILVGRTRRLKNAVNNSVREANQNRIRWGVYLDYASAHNYGFRGHVYIRPHKRMPTVKTQVSTGTFSLKTHKANMKTIRVEGKKQNVRGYGKRLHIPKRQFMGASKTLDRRLKVKAEQFFDKYLKPFR